MEVIDTFDSLREPAVLLKDDIIYVAKTQSSPTHRDNSDNIFFNSNISLEVSPKLPLVIQQFKHRNNFSNPEDIKELRIETKLNKILRFFDNFAFVNLANFKIIQSLLVEYFSNCYSLSDSIRRLKEEIDKHSKDNQLHGKLFISTAVRNNALRLTLTRSKSRDTKQYISFTLDEHLHSELYIFSSSIKNDTKKFELIRNCKFGNRSTNQDPDSVCFDAKVWQGFNYAGIFKKNYLKTLDCIERNRLSLSKFISEVNKKDIKNILNKNLMNNVEITTDNKHVLCLKFNTNIGQHIETKLTKDAAAITIIQS